MCCSNLKINNQKPTDKNKNTDPRMIFDTLENEGTKGRRDAKGEAMHGTTSYDSHES